MAFSKDIRLKDKFNTSFERSILHLLLSSKDFSNQVLYLLKPAYFTKKIHRNIFRLIGEFYTKFNRLPTGQELTSEVYSLYYNNTDTDIRVAIETEINNIINMKDVHSDYILENLLHFIQMAELTSLIFTSVNNWDKVNITDLRMNIDRIEGIKCLDEDDGICNDEFMTNILNRDDSIRPYQSSFMLLDDCLRGGLRNGELAVVLAPTNTGKSFFLVNLARGYMTAGNNVFHYSFEMTQEDIMDRILASMCRIPVNYISDPSNMRTLIETLRNYNVVTQNKLWIKDFKGNVATIADVKAHAKKIENREGIKPDVIILDYLDIVKPSRSYTTKRFELSSLYIEARNLARELNCAVVTASQANRSALSIENPLTNKKAVQKVGLHQVAESIDKMNHADYVISIRKPTKYIPWGANHFATIVDLPKARHSAQGVSVVFNCDFSRSYMEDVPLDQVDFSVIQDEIKNKEESLI